MKIAWALIGIALMGLPFLTTSLEVGIGIADVTGPAAEVTFMGYAKADQKGMGIHLRQFARAFIMKDENQRIVFVSTDVGMMGHGVRLEVLKNLQKKFGAIYSVENVILSGTHTHSAPGGFLRDLLFDLPIFGFVKETYSALISGITQAIVRAHNNMVEAKMYLSKGEILEANINRSPTAYLANPQSERDKYEYDVDKEMVQVRFVSADSVARPLGAIHWYAVHPNSMNNTNRLISSDNVGYAAVLFESRMNNGSLPGQGSFVSAFASTNLGDVSPNIRGPRCMNSGLLCDVASSACLGKRDQCVASGPGKDMFDSTKIIAGRLASKAEELWFEDKGREITGPLKIIHQYVHMPSQKVEYENPVTKEIEIVKGCPAAMGYSFAAGTTDGPGAFSFTQGTITDNPLWNKVRDFLSKPSKEQIRCQNPKPILLNSGEISFPYQWQPNTVATQLALIGDLAIIAVPGEFTTMSGRRMRDIVKKTIVEAGGPEKIEAVVAGLCNIYTDYITTPEEYTVQRYEGASTAYGPHTLTVYLHKYQELAKALVKGDKLVPGPTPPYIKNVITLVPPVLFDVAGWRRDFGDCVQQPAKTVRPGDIVVAKFVAGHPRNNNMHGKTFLTVERRDGDDDWTIIATDANWETKFIWSRKSALLASSEATIEWEVTTDVIPGEYRIRHFGNYKYILGGIYSYQGISNSFQVI